nr:reverse transcriptase domain-containing protein [Tanacetum cinerariifolium]
EYLEKYPDVVTTILPTEEPEHSLSMGYEHLSITSETKSDEVTEFNAENLLPIPSKCEVTLEDEIELSDFVKSLLNHDTFIDFSSKFDFSGELAHIKPEIPKSDFDFEEEIRLIENLLYDNSFPRPPKELNAEIADTIIESIPLLPIPVQDGNSQQEEINIITKTDDVLPLSAENDDDDLSNDSLLEEADLFLSDDSIPPGIENVADDPEGDIRFLEELLIDDSILSDELSDVNFEDNLLISRPPSEPPDVESFFDLKPDVIAEEISDKLNKDKCFKPGREIFVSINNEDVDYFPFMFVIRIFLPYLILPEISPLLLSAESEDTIFDPGTAEGNSDANVVTGTFLLNNHCALILFDTGADKSFTSTAFSSLNNVNPSTLDYSYDVELADGQIIRVEFQIDLIPGAAPVARAPYRLASSEMKELSDQL